MSNRKSLGSSPIGYSRLGSNSYRFIRDLGVTSGTSHTVGRNGSVTESRTGSGNRRPRKRSESGNDTVASEDRDGGLNNSGKRDPCQGRRQHDFKYHSRKPIADLNRDKNKNIDTEADSEINAGNRPGGNKPGGPGSESDFGTDTGSDTDPSIGPGNGIDRETNNFSDTNRDTKMENTPARKFTNIYPNRNSGNTVNEEPDNKQEPDKKIVSYYLDRELIDRLKNLADDQNSYYSAVVSAAISYWVEKHGY